jgi:hypothetical protein
MLIQPTRRPAAVRWPTYQPGQVSGRPGPYRRAGLGDDDDMPAIEQPPTPGERLLHALGRLYWLWRQDSIETRPPDISVDEVARIVGVAREIEFVADGPLGRAYHFPDEVLVADDHDFPWRLYDLDSWALLLEWTDL